MDLSLSLPLFSALVLAVGALRLLELRISRRRSAQLRARGATPVDEPYFRAMVGLHAGVLAGSLLEAWLLARAPSPALAAPMLIAVLAANALRIWVIATLGPHWNVRIVDSVALGVISHGPFRFVRHPNYVAVFVELLALPLVHGAWRTALAGAALHVFVLHHRIRREERVLMRDPAYRARMGSKPRFIPGLL